MKKSTIILSVLLAGSVLYGGIETATAYNNLDIINNQHAQLNMVNEKLKSAESGGDAVTADRDFLKKRVGELNNQLTQSQNDLQKAESNFEKQRMDVLKSAYAVGFQNGSKSGSAGVYNFDQQQQTNALNKIADDMDAQRWGWNK